MKARKRNLQSQATDAQRKIERLTKHVAHLDHMMALARKVTGRDSVEACALASLCGPLLSTQRYRAQQELNDATFSFGCLQQLLRDGKCYLSRFERDCDMMQSFSVRQCNSLESAIRYRDSVYEGAEGPCSVRPLTREEYDEAKPCEETRDLALEAHEDGHPHVIYT